MQKKEKELNEILEPKNDTETPSTQAMSAPILEEITIEELAVDGICGVY